MDDFIIKDDIEIKNGDLVVAFSDDQNIEFILRAKPGHFYQFPTLGVGVVDLIKGKIDRQTLKQAITTNLEADNYRINKIGIGGNIDELITSIDAEKLS